MSTVNASDGDGIRPVNYDDNTRVDQTQGGGDTRNVSADDAQVRNLADAQVERRSLLQFTADYRRFSLDDVLARRNPLVAYSANAQQTAPTQTGLPREELEARAKRIFDRFQNDSFLNSSTPYADIAAELNGLSPQDALQLRQIYQQKYSAQRGGRDLLSDVALEINELQDRLRAFRILAPENVKSQTEPQQSLFDQTAGIVTDPPFPELVTGSSVKYTFNEGATIGPPDSSPFVRYLVQGPNGVETRTGYTFDGQYNKPGVYRVTFEVTYRGRPPRYYTLRQVVRDPAEKAREVLLNMPGTTVDPELFLHGVDAQIQVAEQNLNQLRTRVGELRARDYSPQWEINKLDSQIRNLEDALSQLRQIKQDAPAKLFGGATGPVIPLQAALVPTERPQPVPLQLYAKPLGGNRWAIVDMTSPANARVFEGQAGATSEDGLRSAWREFVSANNLPAGQVAALPPAGMNFPAQEVWNDRSEGRSGFQQWASNLGWGSLALAAAGVVALLVPGLEEFAPPLFIAAGAAGAGSGGLNIYDRVNYGNFRWNSAETALDLLSIVGGVAGAGGGAAVWVRGGVAAVETAEGATVTLRSLGRFTSVTQGVDAGAGVASGVIIANTWLEQIQRINDSNLPPAEKQRQVNAVLQQAAMMGGIIVVGRGVSRFTPLAGEELNNLLRASRFEPELEELVRTTPGLQRALQEQGAEKLRTLYDDYKAGGVNGAGLNVDSFVQYVSSRGVPTRTANVPQSVTEALGVSSEALRRMTVRELNEAVLARANPELLSALRRGDLPAGATGALNEILSQDFKLATASNFDGARAAMSKALNQRLGESAASVAELRQLLGYFGANNQGGSRGSIGNAFYRSRLSQGQQVPELDIPRRLFTTRPSPNVNVRRPDYVLVNGRRTLDIKTGYAAGEIDIEQLKDYNDLINASRRAGNVELRRLLAREGVQGSLTGHDYLFLPNAGDSAETAARSAFTRIENTLAGQTANIRVYYLGDDGKIYQLVKGTAGQPASRLVGDRFPNQ
jgi:hypothetical protein